MRVAILRPVLIGSRIRQPGEELTVSKSRANRMTKGRNPAARLLDSEDIPQIVRQTPAPAPEPPQQSAPAPAPSGPPRPPGFQGPGSNQSPPAGPPEPAGDLTAEQLVLMGIPPKVSHILIEAGVRSKSQLTQENLLQIEGIGEKTAELVLACVQKDAAGN